MITPALQKDVLKLADYGSCRSIYSKQPYTEYISTRWYVGTTRDQYVMFVCVSVGIELQNAYSLMDITHIRWTCGVQAVYYMKY